MNKTTAKLSRIAFMIIALAIVVIFSASCAFAKMNVVTTTPDLADIASNIGGDKITVVSIAKGYQDPHFVEAKPSFMTILAKADLYLVTGMELEQGWSPILEQGARNTAVMKGGASYIDCSSAIQPLEANVKADRSLGDVHPYGNPHYLLDPQNGIVVAGTIYKAFKKKDPANAAYYEANYKTFVSALTKKQIEWLKAMKPYKGLKVVTYHKTWVYFARRFGLDVVAQVEPKPGISPSPAHIASLIKMMKEQKVKVLIREPHFESKIPDMICRETGAKQVVMPIMPGGVSGSNSYIGMFDFIINHLTAAAR
ncbi:MAG: metal ABC transporter substrate-binding protein [Firmicutes bacterium]|nr:metal ABC transporter substrate-binding protein [Bacillota bacterium]